MLAAQAASSGLEVLRHVFEERKEFLHLFLVDEQMNGPSLFDRQQQFTLDKLLDVKGHRGLA